MAFSRVFFLQSCFVLVGLKFCFKEGKDLCEAPSMVDMGTNLPFGKDKSSFPI
jgi:hypothetical protein